VDVAAIATLMTTAENFIVYVYLYLIRVLLMNRPMEISRQCILVVTVVSFEKDTALT